MAHLQAAIGDETHDIKEMQRDVGYEDMTQMDDMTLEGILENCKERYDQDLIYTYTGTILVALNPFKRVPYYGDRWIKKYLGQRIGSQPPHVYALAESAYTNISEKGQDRSLLISGESGSGKTETTKLILRYLTRRTKKSSTETSQGVEKKILESVPILEALGNAKTLRNDNSSRFGKYIEIQFNKNKQIVGSKIIPYLLEKSRVVSQLPGERNFHIFYQITEGATEEMREKYHFGRALDYNYLNKSGVIALSWADYNENRAKT